MHEDIEIDDELLAQYRWRYVCLFTFQPRLKKLVALRGLRKFFSRVQRAEGVRLSWIAIMDENPWEGPFFYVILTGIKVPFRHYVLEWNQTGGHCHVLHSDLRGGLRVGSRQDHEHPGIACFRMALRDSRFRTVSELYPESLLNPPMKRPPWLLAALALKRRMRKAMRPR
jgi:hypothetical protein